MYDDANTWGKMNGWGRLSTYGSGHVVASREVSYFRKEKVGNVAHRPGLKCVRLMHGCHVSINGEILSCAVGQSNLFAFHILQTK